MRNPTHHVPPRSTIAPKAAQPYASRPCAATWRIIKVGKMGKPLGTPPASARGDRTGNGREHSYCLLRIENIA